MVTTTVHLMRHGEVHNPDGILYGRLPGFGLSAHGWAMAERVAETLVAGGHDVRAVVASPLQRAQESAVPTAQAFGLPVRTEDGLIEAGTAFEGLSRRERRGLAHPRHWARFLNPLRPSWGEPYRQVVGRMVAATRTCLDLAPTGGEVVAVSHQLPIWVTRLFLERRPLAHDPRHRQCALASLTSLMFRDRRLVSLTYWEPAGDLVQGRRELVSEWAAARLAGAHSGVL